MNTVETIRQVLMNQQPDKETGMLEIINASFIADQESIFGTVNYDYVRREIDWYLSRSLNVNDIEGEVPSIWKSVATPEGRINSNYGWCVFSEANGQQFLKAVNALIGDKHSRQAVMIYNRPSMHEDSKKDGMHDFMCTHSAHLIIRNDELHYMVNMRSNDAVFGYKNDRAWHQYIWNQAFRSLLKNYENLKQGKMYWNAGSLHVYPRHAHLVK